jgi:hypothetical protein
MSSTPAHLKASFLSNMNRINGLIQLVHSDIEFLKPTGFSQYEGASADILRFVVVFLHATFEMLVRSQTHYQDRKWSFYSAADIERAFRHSGIDATPFESLYPPLTQMARRRNRIVHDADFATFVDPAIEKWALADTWQLTIWDMSVLAFYYRFLISTDENSEVERKNDEQLVQVMTRHVEFGRQTLVFARAPRESRIEAFHKIADSLESVSEILRDSIRGRVGV